jgi:toxin ParE1/3/4
MNYSLFFTDDARADIMEGYDWYEGRREELGEEFLDNLNATLKKIKENPLQYRLQYKEQRAALLNRIPYRVFYFIDKDKVIVQCVVRTSRSPEIWKGRTN